ncbi:MAG: hypothetical protein R3309_17195 [Reinekea sp.]|jgi:uncharacterized integral membrane protein|nr:hypothetical protein [Reinekea sp.]MDX1475913.1 hypothetical protein [Reinekea sp.]
MTELTTAIYFLAAMTGVVIAAGVLVMNMSYKRRQRNKHRSYN